MTTASVAEKLSDGIRAAKSGDKELARRLLLEVTQQDPQLEDAWLWLAGVTSSREEARVYLETVLALNPTSKRAREGLAWLGAKPNEQPSPETVPGDTEGLGTGFMLTVKQAEEIDACLDRMAYESEARCIILADITGQLISERGQTKRMNTQVLSALAAGELAATHELARLVGEQARFKLLLHEGEEHSVYLSDVGEQLIVVIVFDVDTPIGLVRMILKQAVEELEPIIREARHGERAMGGVLDRDFAQLLDDELESSLGLGD